jgi:hypothetical protein
MADFSPRQGSLNVCVVYLARAGHGLESVTDFLRSYQQHPAQAEHDLVLLLKGFDRQAVPNEYRALLETVRHTVLFTPDEGFDVGSYFAAARQLEYTHFCFLNSYSVILDAGWLSKLLGTLSCPGVGLAGATGSWESHFSNTRRPFPTPEPNGRQMREPRSIARSITSRYRSYRNELELRTHFAPFPNPHLRTNAFVIARDLVLRLRVSPMQRKADTARFEAGRRSLTRQIFDMGLRALVVGRDGRAYEKDRWFESCTFRSGDQRNLLVEDNRTRQYREADAATKAWLQGLAWGEQRGQPSRKEQ